MHDEEEIEYSDEIPEHVVDAATQVVTTSALDGQPVFVAAAAMLTSIFEAHT